jgi:Ni/Fe-hydrogenase subunit HybB-like protein
MDMSLIGLRKVLEFRGIVPCFFLFVILLTFWLRFVNGVTIPVIVIIQCLLVQRSDQLFASPLKKAEFHFLRVSIALLESATDWW